MSSFKHIGFLVVVALVYVSADDADDSSTSATATSSSTVYSPYWSYLTQYGYPYLSSLVGSYPIYSRSGGSISYRYRTGALPYYSGFSYYPSYYRSSPYLYNSYAMSPYYRISLQEQPSVSKSISRTAVTVSPLPIVNDPSISEPVVSVSSPSAVLTESLGHLESEIVGPSGYIATYTDKK